jgi:predicted SprT family Zn-dependent metalloprotease
MTTTTPARLTRIELESLRTWAIEKLAEHGLSHWTFVWDNRAVRRYGQCRYNVRQIGVTKKIAELNTIEDTHDVILHEIAHALTKGDHHGPRWRAACRRIGARPERCYRSQNNGGNVATPAGKWALVHKKTGRVYRTYHRKPRIKDWTGRYLRGLQKETYGQLHIVSTS